MRKRLQGAVAAFAVAGLMAAAGCSGEEPAVEAGKNGELTKVTLLTGLAFYGQVGYMFAGQEKGFFREEGLDVKLEGGLGPQANLQKLKAGAAQFAEMDITGAMIEYGAGRAKDWKLIASVEQKTVAGFSALSGSGVVAGNPRSLEGKKVGYVNGVIKQLAPGYEKLTGIDGSKITWVPVQPNALAQVLTSNTVDAATYYLNTTGAIQALEAQAAKASGKAPRQVVNLPYSDYFTDMFGNGIVVSGSYAKEHPDVVKAFSRAIIKSLRWALDNPDETGQIFVKTDQGRTYPGGAAGAAGELKAMKPYAVVGNEPVGLISEERMARAIASLQAVPSSSDGKPAPSFLPGTVTPRDLVAFDLMPTS
jgi:NitT/TauT family transport system substrate-binding protein